MDLVSAFVTLFVIVDPIGMAPVFVTLTDRFVPPRRRAVALEACFIAFIILSGASLFGHALLSALSISIASFRIAGGLLLFALAFEMVFGRRHDRKAGEAEDETAHPAAFPLAFPLLAGPGAITASVLLGEKSGGLGVHLLLMVVIAVVLVLTLLIFRLSPFLTRLLGERGHAVFGRLLGVVLAAMAVQYVTDGITAFTR